MLVLSRRPNQSVLIDGSITLTVVSVRGDKVRLAFDAPGGEPIHRMELVLRYPEVSARHGRQPAKAAS